MADLLTKQLDELGTRMKGWVEQVQGSYQRLQSQVDIIDSKIADKAGYGFNGFERKTGAARLVQELKSGDNLAILNKSGRLILEVDGLLPQYEQKSVLTSSGITTPQAIGGVAAGGRPDYRLRSIFRTVPTTEASVYRLRENVYTERASPQVSLRENRNQPSP